MGGGRRKVKVGRWGMERRKSEVGSARWEVGSGKRELGGRRGGRWEVEGERWMEDGRWVGGGRWGGGLRKSMKIIVFLGFQLSDNRKSMKIIGFLWFLEISMVRQSKINENHRFS